MMAQTSLQKTHVHDTDAMLQQSTEQDPGRVKLPQLRNSMMLDKTKPLPTSLQSDFIPDDVLFALTQPPIPRDKLGPPSRVRNLNTSMALGRAPAANLWSHKRREKFKHLLNSTACSCGAGSDVSFLYDIPQEIPHPEKPDTQDQSAVRKDAEMPSRKALQLPDTLIPTEYHIVKNKGVMGVEYHEDKYTTNPDDHEKHLIVFPSMKPTSRFEVIQLHKTMEEMLEKVGFNDMEVELHGPTQMHNLLELIKKEQNIYNIVFHEIIRQVSIECSERGELLAELRHKYSGLLNKIPQQIMSLHEEVMAQRALDRRLTDELMRFKNTIAILTHELSDVKEHDKVVTREAQKTQEDLRHALTEAQKNAALLSEYHDLYELQRQRLEHQVFVLSEERELWSTAAYSLALKVTEECRLTTAKRLHVSEKGWAKLANHFTILLSDRDTDLLTKIQGHVEMWRDQIEDFNFALRQREEEMKESLKGIKHSVVKWIADFQKNLFNKDGQFIRKPDEHKMKELLADMRSWEKSLSKEVELFGGDLLLSNQEELSHIRKEMEGWTDNALKVFGRHRGASAGPHPGQKSMLQLNEEVETLLKQYQYRITGENGVAAIVINLQNTTETWETRLTTAFNGSIPISEHDWTNLYHVLDEWVASLETAELYVGTTQYEEDRQEGKIHVRSFQAEFPGQFWLNSANNAKRICLDIQDVVRKTQKWATTSSNSIDSEDAKLVEQVSTLHSEMVRWMVQILLRLAPNKEGNSQEAAEMALLGSVSIPQLHENAKSLFETLQQFSNYVTLIGLNTLGFTMTGRSWKQNDPDKKLQDIREQKGHQKQLRASREPCCDGIVMENTQKRQDNMEENADHELKDLQRLRTECEDWIHTAQILVSQLTGESIEDLFPQRASTTDSKSTPRDDHKSPYTYTDREKLDRPDTDHPPPTPAAAAEAETPITLGPSESPQQPPSTAASTTSKPVSEQEERTENMEVLGRDDNTHVAGLKDKEKEKEMVTTSVKAAGAPDTKKAFEALSAVSSLQDQLIMTEQRAQEAEERAATAEADLAASQEEIRALKKQLEEAASTRNPSQASIQSAQGVPSTMVTSPPSQMLSESPHPEKASPETAHRHSVCFRADDI